MCPLYTFVTGRFLLVAFPQKPILKVGYGYWPLLLRILLHPLLLLLMLMMQKKVMDIASSSSSAADNPPRRKKYDVFISFRGEDTRLGITSHLHAALLQKKIETYIDYKLQSGEEIGPALLQAIEKSTISVIIFSQNYASSTWCLDELVHILECKERYSQMVIPVFYHINPSDVRKQHGSYADAFAQLEKRFDNSIDKVHKWRDALTTAANLSGFDYSNKSGTETEANLIQKETPNVEVIEVDWHNLQERPLKCADFTQMSNLIMLIVDGGYTFSTSLDLPDSLHYLDWWGYLLESLPSNFCPRNLVELHMQYSRVTKELWKEEQILVNLQVIDLRGCSNLTEVPNLSRSLKIVEINLGHCRSLVEIPSYFQHLDKLTHLDLGFCYSLKYLPEMPGNIQYLNLEGSGIKELPESVWCNENISYLNLRQCEDLKKLPSSRCKLKNLDLHRCSKFENFPEILEPMEHLKSLSLSQTAVTELPSSICKLKNLEKLDLCSCSKFENFPEILEPMEHLKSLSLIQTPVRELPSSICKLKYLESLYLTNCYRFSKFPEILKPMEHLVSLCLEETAVEMLPSSIGNLNGLQDLNLSRCYLLKDVPTSIYSLTNLKRLNFNDCRRLEKLPSCSVGFFSLEELDLSNSGILEIPASIKQASRLSILDLINCKWLQSIPELPVLCNVKASNSTSLKIVSSSRTALAQGWDKPNYCFKVFTNCPKLDNNSGSNIMDEAQITIMRMATVAPLEDYWLPCNPWPQINIACPGKEIPNWFSYQNEGSLVDIELCPEWFRTGLFGFALSVVLSEIAEVGFGTWRVRANFIVKFMGENHELFTSEYNSYIDFSNGQHHVHVWNEAFRSEEVGKNCSPDVYKLAKEASVIFFCPRRMKVESCGICPLYAEDVEKFKIGHVIMSRGPKVEETRQDDDYKGGGSSDESEANESD
ncbi:hypothetical protein DVH24_010210 [Malus domestica]|uniref:TIR domain-containing protein n=1 Tax=Malus domestica TaxID=3750 RepID=A0A498JRS9_MALDO|nr:hypothetical protein DVH24_010210 [Malus domestica]